MCSTVVHRDGKGHEEGAPLHLLREDWAYSSYVSCQGCGPHPGIARDLACAAGAEEEEAPSGGDEDRQARKACCRTLYGEGGEEAFVQDCAPSKRMG